MIWEVEGITIGIQGGKARNVAQPPKMHSKEVSCPSVTSAGVESPALRDRTLKM